MIASTTFFSVEEVFVRLGENRQKGCLVIFNKTEAGHLFVADGVALCALGQKRNGEAALSHLLSLEDAYCAWIEGADPVIKNIRVNIHEFVLKHCISRDVNAAGTMAIPRKETKHILREDTAKQPLHHKPTLKFSYYFTTEAKPVRKMRLDKVTTIMGRDESCDLTLEDISVSRKHCIFEQTERGLLFRDLGSSNGTYHNGVLLGEGCLHRGDSIRLGQVELRLHASAKSGPE